MILQAAGLHREVFGACTGEFSRWRAGDHLHLVNGVDANGLRDEAVITLLADGFRRKAVEIELTEVVASAADDRKTGGDGSALCTGRQSTEGGWVALRVVPP